MTGFCPEQQSDTVHVRVPTRSELLQVISNYTAQGYYLTKLTYPPWWQFFGGRYEAILLRKMAMPYLELTIGPITSRI